MERVWKMSNSLVHLAVGRHDRGCLSEMHSAYFTFLCGLLSSQFHCSAYDKSVVYMFYILVVIFHSQEFAGSTMEMQPLLYCQGLSVSHKSQ